MGMLQSKKGQAFLVVALAIIFSKFLGLEEKQLMMLSGLASAYVFGQGVADHGKEAAKEENKPLPENP